MFKRAITAIALTASSIVGLNIQPNNLAYANTFGQKEVPQEKFIAIAVPFGISQTQYNLMVLEQVSGKKQCWQEVGNQPASVEPLLLNFDFTGICGRSTDSNGYSIRINGEDMSWSYTLSVIKRDNELILVGTSARDPSAPPLEIGRSYGISGRIDKIYLNPGWRLTKRTYGQKTLGHIYFTTDGQTTAAPAPNPTPLPEITPPPNPPVTNENPPTQPNNSSGQDLIFTPSNR